MYVIRDKKFVLIPLAYNEFCNDIKSLGDSPKYAGEIKVKRILDNSALEDIIEYCSQDKDILYIVDMKNIMSHANRVFKRLLELENVKIIIVNIEGSLIDNIKEDLNDRYEQIDEYTLCSENKLKDSYSAYYDEIHNIYHKETVTIVQWMKQCVTKESVKNIKPLDSSGIYCNMYINAKRLFIDPDKYYFIIYQMICMIASIT